jgi:hypothetical protein
VHDLLDKLLVDSAYTQWVAKQKSADRAKAAEFKRIIRDDDLLENIALCLTVLEPCLKVLRLTDGKKGATLSNVYAKMLDLDVFYREPIDGLDDGIREKIHKIFMARWAYFHIPAMTAAYRLALEYTRREMDDDQDKEIEEVFKKMATSEHTYPAIVADYAAHEIALASKGNERPSHRVRLLEGGPEDAPVSVGQHSPPAVAAPQVCGRAPPLALVLCLSLRTLVVD